MMRFGDVVGLELDFKFVSANMVEQARVQETFCPRRKFTCPMPQNTCERMEEGSSGGRVL